MKNTYRYITCFLLVAGLWSCRKNLEIGDPNAATLEANVSDDQGIIALANGAVSTTGFANLFWLPSAYTDLLGDMICDP